MAMELKQTIKAERASGRLDSLEEIKRQLQHWRSVRKRGEHIPPPLWAAALSAVREHGAHRVAVELRLDYARLQRRVERAGDATRGGEVAAAFVELYAPAAAGLRECVVEGENARGAKMRVELNGKGLAGLPGLCSAFWSAA
jgi:hypothetical protein